MEFSDGMLRLVAMLEWEWGMELLNVGNSRMGMKHAERIEIGTCKQNGIWKMHYCYGTCIIPSLAPPPSSLAPPIPTHQD